MSTSLSVAMVAGEASGDSHGTHLIRALKAQGQDLVLFGIGGPGLRNEGMECLAKAENMAVVGLVEVVAHLPGIWSAYRRVLKALKARKPDVLILVDYPDFNLRLAKKAAEMGIPVVYFVSPQVWAWRSERIHQIRRDVRHMLVILPFEEDYYREEKVPVTFVGHPLVEHPPPTTADRTVLRSRLGLDLDRPVAAFAPGSRSSEVNRILPVLAETAELLQKKLPGIDMILPVAPALDAADLSKISGPIRPLSLPYRELLAASNVAAVASGTACLEAALTGVPTCIVYRLKPMTYRIAKKKVKVEFAGMPNLIHPDHPWPELVQDDFQPQALAEQMQTWLEDDRAGSRFLGYSDDLKSLLKGPGLEAGAKAILDLLEAQSTK